jgi:predicted MPP superfamily phosphohydrolase
MEILLLQETLSIFSKQDHGGMIPGLDRLVARANNGFVSGRYQVGGMTLYVNNGTALWPGFALRLGRSSELTRITLRRASPQDGSPTHTPTSLERTLAPATAG